MTDHLPGMAPEDDMPEALRSHSGRCRSCGAPIVWAMTRVDGPRTMPVDPTPVANGNVRLWTDGRTLRATVSGSTADDGIRYRSHFATCPNAKDFRKKKP